MANGTTLILSCIDCGRDFEYFFRRGNKPKRCPSCKAEFDRARARKDARKARERHPKPRVDMSKPLVCAQCGAEFMRHLCGVAAPKKCPTCRYFGKFPSAPLPSEAGPAAYRCLDCGSPVPRTGGRRRRCLEHWLAYEVDRNRAKEAARVRPSKAKPAPPPRKCLDCDELIYKSFTKWPERCSTHARVHLRRHINEAKAARLRAVRDAEPDPKCVDCGSDVPRRTRGKQIRRCGDCRRMRTNAIEAERQRNNPEARRAKEKRYRDGHREQWRAKLKRRRARHLGARTAERFTDREIFERDRWICQICKRKVNKKLRFPHPMSASLDHVVPLVEGGQHTRANTRLAHFRCNCARRDRGGNEQLALIG